MKYFFPDALLKVNKILLSLAKNLDQEDEYEKKIDGKEGFGKAFLSPKAQSRIAQILEVMHKCKS